MTDADVRRYVNGDLAPGELLSTDDHLAMCAACRGKAESLLAAGADSLRELKSFGSHLSDDELQRAASDELDPQTAAAVAK